MVIFKSVVLGGLISLVSTWSCATDEILGHWKTVNSRTGKVAARVEFVKEPDGSYSGYIRELFDEDTQQFCHARCPAPYQNAPMVGLRIMWALKASAKPLEYSNGFALDPLSGRVYHGRARVTPDQRRLFMRGYIGASILGRTEVWLRDTSYSPPNTP